MKIIDDEDIKNIWNASRGIREEGADTECEGMFWPILQTPPPAFHIVSTIFNQLWYTSNW